jgi:hypothetical protein
MYRGCNENVVDIETESGGTGIVVLIVCNLHSGLLGIALCQDHHLLYTMQAHYHSDYTVSIPQYVMIQRRRRRRKRKRGMINYATVESVCLEFLFLRKKNPLQ